MRSSRSSGRSPFATASSSAMFPLDRELHLAQGVRRRDAPVRSHRQHRARCSKPSERISRPRHRSPMNGIVSLSICSSWAPNGCALASTPSSRNRAEVVGVDHLDVGDVRARIRRAVLGPRRGHGVERFAHRPVADRVEVRLDGEAHRSCGTQVLRPSGVDLDEPPVVGRAAVAVAVRLDHGAREVLEDAVHHQLHAGRLVTAHRGRPAGVRRTPRSARRRARRSHHLAPTTRAVSSPREARVT